MRNSHRKLSFPELVLMEGKHYTIINKPPHIASLDDRAAVQNLLSLARQTDENFQICHRLDKETSGAVVFAKHADAYRHFAMQLEHREVKKVYHAVVDGLHMFEDFEANEPLHTSSTKSSVDFRTGKPSLTLVSTLEVLKQHTLVKCFPVTGRMHQIRVHLAHHKAPIVSDTAYGGAPPLLSDLKRNYNRKKWEEEKPMIQRVALHAYQVAFKDMDGSVVEAVAPYPKDFLVLLKGLRKYN